MAYSLIQITTDNKINLIPCDWYKINLETLYKHSNCSTIQIVRTEDYKEFQLLMCLDDNGKILHKPINKIATDLYGAFPIDFIVGDVVLGTQFSDNPFDEPDIFAMDDSIAKRIAGELKLKYCVQ